MDHFIMATKINHMGTSKNQHRSSGAPKLLANDSGLFPFRFYAVHPKDAGDPKPQQFFEVPLTAGRTRRGMAPIHRRPFHSRVAPSIEAVPFFRSVSRCESAPPLRSRMV